MARGPAAGGRSVGTWLSWAAAGLVAVLTATLVAVQSVHPTQVAGDPAAAVTPTATSSLRPFPDSGTSVQPTGSSPDTTAESTEQSSETTENSESTEITGGSVDTGTTTPTTPTATSGSGRVLRVSLRTLPTSPDPMFAYDSSAAEAITQVFEGLTAYSADGRQVGPGLAQSWTLDATGRTWTFQLRAGARFQDGSAVTGADVCANFDRWSHLPAAQQGDANTWTFYFGGFADQPSLMTYRSCQPVSGGLTIAMSKPLGYLPDALALPQFGIRSPKSFSSAVPIGSGPYRWISNSGTVMMLTAADERARTRQMVITANAPVDATSPLPDADIIGPGPALSGTGSRKSVSPPANLITSLWLNQGAGRPLADPGLRRAVDLAIDRQRLAAVAPGAQPTGSILPPVTTVSGELGSAPAQDLAAAAELVRASATPHPSLVLLSRSAIPSQRQAQYRSMEQLVTGWLTAAGFLVKPKTVTSAAAYFDAFSKGTTADLGIVSFLPLTADPVDFLQGVLPSVDTATGVTATVPWRTAVQREIDAAAATLDATTRRIQGQLAAGGFQAGRTLVPVMASSEPWVIGSGVSGFQPSPLGFTRLDSVSVG